MAKHPKEHGGPPPDVQDRQDPFGRLPAWSWPALVLLAGVLPFLPAIPAGFFTLDDPQRLVDNPSFRGLGLAQLKWIFLSFHPGGTYEPVTWLSHAADFLLWGFKPAGVHAAALALHALNGVLLYLLILRVLQLASAAPKDASRAWLRLCAAAGAALFVSHPLRVEVVAWASQRGYLLAAFFALASTLAYLEAHAPLPEDTVGRNGWLAVSFCAYALSLLAEPVALALPLLFLLLDVWPLRRTSGDGTVPAAWDRLLLEKWHYFALALTSVVVASNARYVSGRVIPWDGYGALARLGQAAFAVSFSLEKTLLPVDLSPVYEAPNVGPALLPLLHPFDALCSLRVMALLALTGGALWALRRRPLAAGLWLAYLALALPGAGSPKYEILQQIAGDRWSYLPALCSGAAVSLAAARLESGRHWLAHGLALLLLVLAAASWRQAGLWSDPVQLWRHAAEAAPSCRTCALTSARLLGDAGDHDEALRRGEESLRLSPGLNAYPALIREAQAAGYPERAVRFGSLARGSDPAGARALAQQEFFQGFQSSQQGKIDEALEHTLIAAALDPAHPGAQYNLGFFYQTKGMLPTSEKYYREAVRLNPAAGNAHHNLGVVLASQGKVREAVPECLEALRLSPSLASPQCPTR